MDFAGRALVMPVSVLPFVRIYPLLLVLFGDDLYGAYPPARGPQGPTCGQALSVRSKISANPSE